MRPAPRGLRPWRWADARRGIATCGLAMLFLSLAGLRPASAEPIVAGLKNLQGLQAGRLLLSELGCVACHPADPAWKNVLPPIRMAPLLQGAGSRLRPAWVREYLVRRTPAGRTMPDMMHHLDPAARAEAADHLVHYLMSNRGKPPRVVRHGDAFFGRTLYRRTGCVACHVAEPRDAEATRPVAPLPELPAKYTLHSLTEFLLNPLARRPGGRMPSHQFDVNEASDLAAFLCEYDIADPDTPTAFKPDAAKVEAGRATFRTLGCVSCHADLASRPETPSRPLTSLDPSAPSSCLQNPAAGMPSYDLSPRQQQLLRELLGAEVGPANPGDRLDLWLQALNCLACHERDHVGGVDLVVAHWFSGDEALGRAGRFPPHLTRVGTKLKPDWLQQVLEGKGRVRPYLDSRMPWFGPHNTKGLAPLLVKVDAAATERHPPPLAQGDVEAGRLLVGTEGGMGCITCHGWKDREGLTLHALNLSTSPARLGPEWFRRYLLNPAELRPGTLMPSFWPDGISGNPGILDGDTERQIASIWAFLKEGEQAPGGYPDHPRDRYVLVPTETVIVQRGFLQPGGTHGVAVGFPQARHYVFDAEACRPEASWEGRFLDAYKLWFSRMDPTAKPAGDLLPAFPPGLPFQIQDVAAPRLRFRGYSLTGPDRAPVFLYEVGDLLVSDLITPAASAWRRRLDLRTRSKPVAVTPSPAHAPHWNAVPDPADRPMIVAPKTNLTLTLEYPWE